jgi:hypothetical protein
MFSNNNVNNTTYTLDTPAVRHVLKGRVESWSGVLETPSWSVVYDFSVDIFCKLGIDK